MANEKMISIPGTPGWIANNTGQQKNAATTESNLEKEASPKDVAGMLSFGRKGYRDLMKANEKFQEVGSRYERGEASEAELAQARDEYEPFRKKSVKSLRNRLALATATPVAVGVGLHARDKWKARKK